MSAKTSLPSLDLVVLVAVLMTLFVIPQIRQHTREPVKVTSKDGYIVVDDGKGTLVKVSCRNSSDSVSVVVNGQKVTCP